MEPVNPYAAPSVEVEHPSWLPLVFVAAYFAAIQGSEAPAAGAAAETGSQPLT